MKNSILENARDFCQKLKDGTVENQLPDGSEILSSMNRATIDENGHIVDRLTNAFIPSQ